MSNDTEMDTWMAKVEEHRRGNLDPRIDAMMSVPLRVKFDMPKPDPIKFIIGQRFGGLDVRPRDPIITMVEPPAWMQTLLSDGWMIIPHGGSGPIASDANVHWFRNDGGRISYARSRSGRYLDQPATNRKRKRARCKARRRARLPRRHWVARRRRGER